MKKVVLAAFTVLVGSSLFAFDDSPFITPNGGAKSFVQTEFTITTKFGDYYRSPSTKYKHIFNELGLETESAEYSPGDQLVDKIVYSYTGDGKIVSQTCFDDKGNVFWKINSVFGKDGRKTEENEYDAKGVLLGKTVFKYEDSNSTDETYYNSRGDLIWKNTYFYDELGKLIENCAYFSNGTLDVKKVYQYGDNGKLLEISSFNNANELISREVYNYNEDSTVSEYAVYGANGKRRTRVFYKYDAFKNVIKTTTYNISQKFGSTINEMVGQSDYAYEYPAAESVTER